VIWLQRIGLAALVLAVLAGVGWIVETTVSDYVGRIILQCGINIILAVGLNLINGTTGQFSIGHAGFMAVGAYGCAITVIAVEDSLASSLRALPDPIAHGVVLTLGLLVAASLAGLAGVLVGAPSLRLRGDYLAIVTLGFGEIIRLVFNNAESLGGATGYSGGRALGLPVYSNFFTVFAWAAFAVVVVTSLTRSAYGRALAQIREDEISAESIGLPTTRLKVIAFVVSSMAAGIAGGLYGHMNGSVRPDDFKFDRSIEVIVMIIVGGLGSISGAVLGAVVITVLLELLREAQQFRLIAYSLLLIATMLLRPEGLLGRRELTLGWMRARLGGGAK
jgi:branched-chain amino acid transport system permease protein